MLGPHACPVSARERVKGLLSASWVLVSPSKNVRGTPFLLI